MTTVNSSKHIVLISLDNIEREIRDLKRLLGDKPGVRRSMRGIWRGMPVTDQDIEEAKQSWMKKVDEFNGGNDG
jgi:hypothetical protein